MCYCTDGGVFSSWGIPTVVLGPGSIRNAHGIVEFVEIAELEQAIEIYIATAQGYKTTV